MFALTNKFFILLAMILPGALVSAMDFSKVDLAANNLPAMRTIQIAHQGELVFAESYHGVGLNDVANIKSASKTLMSAIIGIAIEKQVLDGTEQKVAALLEDQLPKDADPRLNDITIGHLLSMQAGLARTSGPNYGKWVISDNWVQYALSRPFEEEPGGDMQYSTGSTHLLSAILMRESGRHTYLLANEWLADAGIQIESWETDPQGIPMGGNQVSMRPASLLALGELYRRGGITEQGERLLSQEWIQQSWTRRTQSRFHRGGYGYGWFIQTFGGAQGYYGWGYGGQMIYVLPELELTIAITSDEFNPSARTGYRSQLHTMVSRYIVPEIRSHRSATETLVQR